MENQELGCYVVMSSEILLATDISDGQKILLALISGLAKQNQWCTASNDYLASTVGKTVGSVSNSISDLVNKGYLVRQIIRNELQEVISRKLAVRNMPNEVLEELAKVNHLAGTPPHKKMGTPPHKKMDTSPLKNGYPSPLKNGIDNSIISNTDDNSISITKTKSNKNIINKKEAQNFKNCENPISFRDGLMEIWYQYKAEKKQSYKPLGKMALIKKVAGLTDEQLQEAIEHSMANNYQGIFPPKANHNVKQTVKPNYNQGMQGDQVMVAAWRRKQVAQDPNWTPDTVN